MPCKLQKETHRNIVTHQHSRALLIMQPLIEDEELAMERYNKQIAPYIHKPKRPAIPFLPNPRNM